MSGLAELWKRHQQAPFPSSCLPLSVDGLRLVKLDAVVGAILTGSLRTDGVVRRLDESKRRELERHREIVLRALRDLTFDAEGRAYFEQLAALADHVLRG